MIVNQNEVKSTALENINMYFENISFQSSGKNIKDNTNEIDVGFKENHKYEENKIFIKLYCKVEKKDSFELNLCLVGIFIVGKDFPVSKLLPCFKCFIFFSTRFYNDYSNTKNYI